MQRSKKKDYVRQKKLFLPPFARMDNMSLMPWDRGLLPEFLWVESLVSTYGRTKAVNHFNFLLDAIDEYERIDGEVIVLGTISSFDNFEKDTKDRITKELALVIHDSVVVPFGGFLKAYPDCPMAWLIKDSDQASLEQEKSDVLAEVSESVMRLFAAKDEYAGHIRALPLIRMFKHGKIHIVRKPSTNELVDSLAKYPNGTHDENYRVESFARMTLNMNIMKREEDSSNPWEWSQYFWRINAKEVGCSND